MWGAHYSVPLHEVRIPLFDKTVHYKKTKFPWIIVGLDFGLLLFLLVLEWRTAEPNQIGAILSHFGSLLLTTSIIAILSVFVTYILIRREISTYTAKEIDSQYIDFTEELRTSSSLLLIAGDLSFLGKVPNIQTMADSPKRKECKKKLLNKNEIKKCGESGPQCSNCIMQSNQFIQLVRIFRESSISLGILCRKPKDDDITYRLVLGALLHHTTLERVDVRFYTEDMDTHLHLRGRLKRTPSGSQELYWHWKNARNAYQAPVTWYDRDPDGRTLIYLYQNVLWEKCKSIENDHKKTYIAEYKENVTKAISIKSEDSHEEDG